MTKIEVASSEGASIGDMGTRRSAGRSLLWALSLIVVAGCTDSDPERDLRERIDAAVTAAEARNTGFFRDLIAPGFVDQRGNDRDAIVALVRGQFLIHSKISVMSRVQDIVIAGDDAAETVLVAGMVGSAGQRAGLGSLSADLYRIELEWARDGSDWRVIGARWSRLGEP